MKRGSGETLVSLLALIAVSLGIWGAFREVPNFAPVAGMALFAGFYYPQRRLAMLAPLGFMLVKDLLIGGYQPLLMVAVYSMVVLPVLFRGWLRSAVARLGRDRTFGSAAHASFSLITCSLIGSLLFFLVTNVATWIVTPWYDRSWAGLGECLVNAIPFLRFTVAGDICSALAMFGTYGLFRTIARRESLARSRGMATVAAVG